MAGLIDRLGGGDRRSIGEADRVAAEIAADPRLIAEVIPGLASPGPVIRMRCADVMEKVSRMRPDCLVPFRAELLARAAEPLGQEVRWHLAQTLPRLSLGEAERDAAEGLFTTYLQDRSRIVQTFALQALFNLAGEDPERAARARDKAMQALTAGSPALRARARKLLAGR